MNQALTTFRRSAFMASIVGLLITLAAAPAWAAEESTMTKDGISIHADYPGGNVLVKSIEGRKVEIEPDLRGGRPWFYWNFEITVDQPGRVTFVLPAKMSGVTGPAIGRQGPAVSLDGGETWDWAGETHVEDNTFFYEFTEPAQTVRLAITLPYLQKDLDAFLKENEDNAHLSAEVLTTSLKGRPVELLQIGQPGPDKKAVLFTARHHACETIASYVLEGFLRAAVAETPEATDFRERFVLYVVPFVDKDGVEEGDQGKNRNPHDHNRDYGEDSLYPEVDAIEALADDKQIRLMLDLHCPTIQFDDHQVMYFVGTKQTPARNNELVSQFASLIKEGLPPNSPVGPLNWMKNREPMPSGSNCNRYFSFKEGMIMAATLEIPYAPRGTQMDPARCREYGQVMFDAWLKTSFDETP